MKDNYTHITVLLDRTGSMQSIRQDTIGGFNAFLNQQKEEPDLATLTLVQFDSQDPYEVVHNFRAIQSVPELTQATFVPRASTPLLDAMGRCINDLEQNLMAIAEAERPARMVVVVITDGQENASREFRAEQVRSMIQEKQDNNDWQFVFLSADLAAINDALASGVKASATMAFDKNSRGTAAVWKSASARIADYRAARKPGVAFSNEDRVQQESERQR
ncbi:MAG: vWA domain-containing protein [Cyanobacteria bacterium J06632_22]